MIFVSYIVHIVSVRTVSDHLQYHAIAQIPKPDIV